MPADGQTPLLPELLLVADAPVAEATPLDEVPAVEDAEAALDEEVPAVDAMLPEAVVVAAEETVAAAVPEEVVAAAGPLEAAVPEAPVVTEAVPADPLVVPPKVEAADAEDFEVLEVVPVVAGEPSQWTRRRLAARAAKRQETCRTLMPPPFHSRGGCRCAAG